MMSLRLSLLFLLMVSGVVVPQQQCDRPKSVSVSISPSGEIMEGSSVTLTCSSDANPPMKTYAWYKGGSLMRTGKTFTIHRIKSANSGVYTCAAENIQGRQSSTAVALKVLYPPRRVSVSISPSGDIVEGSSVTLTCYSDANPPVETYTWYKEKPYKSKGKTFIINNISSVDSGVYSCKAVNRYGFKYSDKTTVNILYPPKRVSVSISPSGEIKEGSLVTLTCYSDANPPVETYTWYKVNESSPVGSGQSYSFTLSSSSSGWFYCVAQNKYGCQKAAPVHLTVKEDGGVVLYVVLGLLVCCGCLFVTIGVLCMRRNRKDGDDAGQSIHLSTSEETYTDFDSQTRSSNHTYYTFAPVQLPMYMALDPQTRSSNDMYHRLATAHLICPHERYTSLDPQTRSSNDMYHTLANLNLRPPDDRPALNLQTRFSNGGTPES
ncbi:B-cell receptor CD22-like [Silurus meridionalis]|uniref:B-cell receptor CD22-like n=1 Tax=Silurus meridionalis TaxID=175797 RepID=UPI001EEC1373|nr:B-cell receptor CD22-like [Silurus meridionalis]